MGTSTAVAVRGEISDAPLPAKLNGGGISELLTLPQAMALIEPSLPDDVSYRELVATVMLQAKNSPEILECTPLSIVTAVRNALATGLTIGETVHLVAFNNKVSRRNEPDRWEKHLQHLIHYRGLIQLIIASGAVRDVDARVVFEKDEFEVSYGPSGTLWHKPWGDTKTRGKPIGAYTVFYLPFGRSKWLYMHLGDASTEGTIEYIRQKYSKKYKSGTCPLWYMVKTVIRQLAKLSVQDRRMAKALAAVREDEAIELEAPTEAPALPAPEDYGSPDTPALPSGDRPANVTTDGEEMMAEDVLMPMGRSKGKRLGDLETKDLEGAAAWCREKGKYADLVEVIGVVLANRASAVNGESLFPEDEQQPPFQMD
ncbi:MAG TPA: recombinase RecT [Gemmatimonadaceae bacterium]|nr:recombinase RecT [Gemmatimonadaceae bacterium]